MTDPEPRPDPRLAPPPGQVIASEDVAEAARVLAEADRVLVGAGAGLSAAAGYDYFDTDRFAELFPAFRRHGFWCRYELVVRPLPPRHQWGYWALHVHDIRLGTQPNPLYRQLRGLVGDRPHFVVTANVDALFVRNGFAAEHVFTPQGDYARAQCRTPCSPDVWDARPLLARALAAYDDASGAVAEDAVPACPHCGGAVTLNVNTGRWFVSDPYRAQGQAMARWQRETRSALQHGRRLAILDLGSGFNTPGVVRWPLEQLTLAVPHSRLIRVNRDHPDVPEDIADRSFSLRGDAGDLVRRLAAG